MIPTGTGTYPIEPEAQFSLQHFPTLNLLVLGLNSAWEIDWFFRSRASIHRVALERALNHVRSTPEYSTCLKVAVWHHPLVGAEADRITDHGFLERLAVAGFRIALHGHIHKAEKTDFHYDLSPGGRGLDIVSAGTFGAPTREWRQGVPLQYNLLRFEPGRVMVETRRREEPNGAWKPDARWTQGAGKDPLPRYFIKLT
ncbi:hypothetical protein JQX13_04445 [Archangium violaceum]|uniref:metallophosphoesterase family protein n=1 Tax=Archangium violaceum TaxID=83451 RepID=UPI00193C537E|nr:hypothetical protein [Archangium violaceum]QRK09400.1 hypothetical protein JQX13_04445 [Archangium violaceum]